MVDKIITRVSIIPAILATTERDYQKKLQLVNNSNLFEGGWIQVDFADNEFVPNKTVYPKIVALYPTSLYKEAHLMVADPLNWVDELARDGFKRIIFHLEVGNTSKIIEKIKGIGLQVGLAINPKTEVGNLEPFIDRIDLVLVMSINPGFAGQGFIASSIKKIEQVAKLKARSDFLLEVDGGIDEHNVKNLALAGADNLAIGSHLIEGDIDENLEKIWEAIRS